MKTVNFVFSNISTYLIANYKLNKKILDWLAEWRFRSLLFFLDNNSTDAVLGYQADAEKRKESRLECNVGLKTLSTYAFMHDRTFCLTPTKLLADLTLAPIGSPARAVQRKCPTIEALCCRALKNGFHLNRFRKNNEKNLKQRRRHLHPTHSPCRFAFMQAAIFSWAILK